MLDRFAENYLNAWYGKSRRKPLVLRGARQVGKSSLVRIFAAQKGLTICEVNLERHLFLNEVFKTSDISLILKELEALTGQNIRSVNVLLFLDEIQATPYAIQALRYFYEDLPALPVVAAGSLLEFALADHPFPMPVGRIEYYHLHPLSFSEYLAALEPPLAKYLLELGPDGLPAAAHKKLLQRQREFFFVGGMPEAVAVYKESDSLAEVSAVQRNIVNTYQDDFAKYAKRLDLALLQKVFSYIPRALGKKIKYSAIANGERAKKIRDAITLLGMARICHPVYHSHASGMPLHAEIDEQTYKLLFLDIGLANHICGIDWLTLKSLGERQLVNEGGLAEQFVGQHLINSSQGVDQPRIHYWLRERKIANAEVDYVISQGNWIVPVEVKAGKSGSLKSLHQFVYEKGAVLAVRFYLNPPGLQQLRHVIRTAAGSEEVRFTLLSLPVYAVEELPRLIDELRQKS